MTLLGTSLSRPGKKSSLTKREGNETQWDPFSPNVRVSNTEKLIFLHLNPEVWLLEIGEYTVRV